MTDGPVGLGFDPEWRITLFTLLMVPLMVWLGFWQLDRAEEKAAIAVAWDQQQAQAPVPLQSLVGQAPDQLAYRPASATGRYRQSEYLLLDNRTHGGRFGYEVLGIMDLDQGGLAVLVNRGWIAGDPSRQSLPTAPVPQGRQTLRGHVYVPPGKPYLLEEQEIAAGWPKIIQAIEMDKIVPGIAEATLFPHVLRLDADSPSALTVNWKVVNVKPEKHRGYAVQWFTMAAVLAIFYLLRSSNIWQLLAERMGKGR